MKNAEAIGLGIRRQRQDALGLGNRPLATDCRIFQNRMADSDLTPPDFSLCLATSALPIDQKQCPRQARRIIQRHERFGHGVRKLQKCSRRPIISPRSRPSGRDADPQRGRAGRVSKGNPKARTSLLTSPQKPVRAPRIAQDLTGRPRPARAEPKPRRFDVSQLKCRK